MIAPSRLAQAMLVYHLREGKHGLVEADLARNDAPKAVVLTGFASFVFTCVGLPVSAHARHRPCSRRAVVDRST